MPRVRLPESDEGRLQLLSTSVNASAVDSAAGRAYLPAPLAASIATFLNDAAGPPVVPGYRSRVHQLTAKRATLAAEHGSADATEALLEVYTRDFWEVLKRRTFREKLPVAVLNFYGLPQDGSIPPITNRADRHSWAQKIVDGEAPAVAAGYPAMANPSAAEVGAKLLLAQQEAALVMPKDRDTELTLEAVRAQRPVAIGFVEDIVNELRHSLRKLAPGTARDIMRSYGVEFDFLPGETPDPTPPAPAPPAP